MECIKTCPYDNMTVRARPFCSDTKLKGYDEAWKAFIMISLAAAYSAIFLGPWGLLKDLANVGETGAWLAFLGYGASLWALALLILPGIYAGSVWLGRRLAGAAGIPWRESFLGMVYPLVPLGLFAWIAFSFPLMFINGSYILNVISDPLGWGWDILGTAGFEWTPVLPHWMPYVQTVLLAVGLVVGLREGYRRAGSLYRDRKRAVYSVAPTAILLGALVTLFLRLYTG